MRSDGVGCGAVGWRICGFLSPWIPRIFGGATPPAIGRRTRCLATAAGSDEGSDKKPRPRGSKLAVVGLGNPGRQFAGTRHNVGFDVVTALASAHRASFRHNRSLEAEVATITLGEPAREVRLVKPATYMNASGRTVRKLKLPREALLIVTDDMALDVGRVKLRPSGSAGGHNGLKSVEQAVGGRDYARLRIGVGEARGGAAEWKSHVLGGFSRAERAELDGVYIDCMNVIEEWAKHDEMKLATDLLSRLIGQRRK